jgi:phosphoserine phosphatase
MPVRTALVYDFDGTLAPGSMQEHSFIPAMGIEPAVFWADVKERTKSHNVDEILVYMWRMLEAAKQNKISVTREMLKAHGANLPLFPGVREWFGRIRQYGMDRGLAIEHYVISSGIYEIIRGCTDVYTSCTYTFASKFIYEEDVAIWPGTAINYTTKTQHLFRINKGIDNIWDNSLINRWIPPEERPIPFDRIVFIGDGETDIPAMKTVREQGGQSIAVYDPQRFAEDRAQRVLYNLIAENRVSFVAPADYEEGSQLDITVKGALGRIARRHGYRGES